MENKEAIGRRISSQKLRFAGNQLSLLVTIYFLTIKLKILNHIKVGYHGYQFLDSWLPVLSLKNGLITRFIGYW